MPQYNKKLEEQNEKLRDKVKELETLIDRYVEKFGDIDKVEKIESGNILIGTTNITGIGMPNNFTWGISDNNTFTIENGNKSYKIYDEIHNLKESVDKIKNKNIIGVMMIKIKDFFYDLAVAISMQVKF